MTATLPGYDAWRTACPPEPDERERCRACDSPRTERDERRGERLCEECREEER